MRYVRRAERISQGWAATWATFGNPSICIGFTCIVMLLLLGKCKPLAAFFDGLAWLAPSKIIAAFNTCSPMVFMLYFMSTSNQLNYEFLPMFYCFFGNLVFGVVFTLIISTISDFPMQLIYWLSRTQRLNPIDDRLSLKDSLMPARINNTDITSGSLGRTTTGDVNRISQFNQE